jgi:TonB family protein
MKKIIHLLILAFALFGCSPSEFDQDLIQDRNGTAYVPNASEPFTGKAVAYYPSGQQKNVTYYDKGKPSGISYEWHANGQIKTEQHFSGTDEGRIRDWHENGEVARDIRVLNETLIGKNVWKSKDFEFEVNVSNGLADGDITIKKIDSSTTSIFEKGLLKYRKRIEITENTDFSSESRFEHRKEGAEIRLSDFNQRTEYKSAYRHKIEEIKLESAESKIITTSFEKEKDDKDYSVITSEQSNDWKDSGPNEIFVDLEKGKFIWQEKTYIGYSSLITGKYDGISWDYWENEINYKTFDEGVLNGWYLSFDREIAKWNDDPSCFISGDFEYETKKCEMVFGKPKIPNYSTIPEKFKKIIEGDKNKVAKGLMAKAKVEAEKKRKLEADKKRKSEAENKRKAEIKKAKEIAASIKKESADIQNYAKVIRRHITDNWIRPSSMRHNLEATIRIEFEPSGRVVSAEITNSSGSQNVDKSFEEAVAKISKIDEFKNMSSSMFEKNFRTVTILFTPSDRGFSHIMTEQEQDTQSEDYWPIYVPQPQYPRQAQTRGKEGYAVVEVIVTVTGEVRDVVVVDEFPEGWGFGRSALKAANRLKYKPRVIDGQAQEVSGVLHKFNFQMAK